MKKQFINEITKALEEKYSINIIVSIEYPTICLQSCYDLEIYEINETETTIDIDDGEMGFKFGKNYTEVIYDEYENEYTFKYENGVVISITII